MKKKIALMLSVVLTIGLICGCGGQSDNQKDINPDENGIEASQVPSSFLNPEVAPTNTPTPAAPVAGQNDNPTGGPGTINNADYVLIYNPFIYNEQDESDSANLYTGDFSKQIIVPNNRADGWDLDVKVYTAPQAVPEKLEIQDIGRGPGLIETFKEGDRSDFYYFSDTRTNTRTEGTFTCEYAGKHCYVWSIGNSISTADAKKYGEVFDNKIYVKDTEAFGQARFTDEGGKINMLVYPMNNGNLCGFFYFYDILAVGEVPLEVAAANKLNLSRAIINLNAELLDDPTDEMAATIAHEFQHLICATNSYENPNTRELMLLNTWLNESMSAYAEELNYPGIKESESNNCNLTYYLSDNFRKGQSLYNFSTDQDRLFGAYGTVYLFEEYLRHYCGDDTFTKIHEYWRSKATSELSDAKDLYNCVSPSFRDTIDQSVQYPESVTSKFQGAEEEWLSKLALNFYMETLGTDLANLDQYVRDAREAMVYDETAPTDIQGGGRIIVATQGGSYTIPSDASEGLVYIGLDRNYKPVTEIITSAGK